MIRVRIAPSPTGSLHIGTARTALFNYLFARNCGGKFMLRIEDTDLERSDPKYEKDILEGLAWLGISWDGDITRQSERIDLYERHLKLLLDNKTAFYCPHSEEELEKERKKQFAEKEPPRHICDARDKNIGEGILRFKNTSTEMVVFKDAIRGKITFNPALLGDFSLAKNTKTPLYNFAVVVDDADMEITHVIRGEDHISNTPKQILIQAALGFSRPAYAHLPLILGTDRSKLSKRHGADSVIEYREAGYLPEALFNFMALLGWNPGNNREILSKEELIKEFSLGKVQKAGAVFDITKLDWMNGEYIRKKSVTELTELCLPYLTHFLQLPISKPQFPNDYIEKVIALEQPRLKRLSEIGERADYFFKEPIYEKELLRWKKMSDDEISASLDISIKLLSNLTRLNLNNIEKAFLEKIVEGDKGILLWPLRVALTGKKASPGPFEILAIMAKEDVLKYLRNAKNLIA